MLPSFSTMKSVKGRKISLPWFRQSSVQKSHAALSRQHTIDNCTAKSFEGSKSLQVQISHLCSLCFLHEIWFGAQESRAWWKKNNIKIHDVEFFLFFSSLSLLTYLTMRFREKISLKFMQLSKLPTHFPAYCFFSLFPIAHYRLELSKRHGSSLTLQLHKEAQSWACRKDNK